MTTNQDVWSQWLLQRRFGGDPQQLCMLLDSFYPIRDKVLDRTQLRGGETLLDVGCGDGLIAFGALERFPTCSVIFSDISKDLLDRAQSLAHELNVSSRCQFVRAAADDLAPIPDISVDVVITRSVLIYIDKKQQPFEEFYRVLKPNGRFSIFEPINRFSFPEPPQRFWWYDISPIIEIAGKVKQLYHQYQPSETDPMLNFDERDLLNYAERAGFQELHLELYVDLERQTEDIQWDTWVQIAWNPKMPTLAEAIEQVLNPDEAHQFISYLRPLVENKQGRLRTAGVYVWGVK
ncbi:class I SAM-dependent methyltransferase [Pleurocapsales cyanobacterium LEGE 06147]|nr:class I SAM-dependent methyltransferase [Pleurocapsales cyanobacterium LEGE 06147]